jgi:cytosine/adenosine deaminase-related metal-dependent hydrolase
MPTHLIRDVRLALPGRVDLPLGSMLIEGERISGVFVGAGGPSAADQVTDGSGAALLPGLVNAHHHSYSNVLRGTRNDRRLESWALYTVAYGYSLGAEAMRLAILLGAAEAMRHGVTALVDHAPHVAHADASLAAHRESGLRVGYAPFFHDRSDHDLLGVPLPDEVDRAFGAPQRPPEDIAGFFRRLARDWHGRDGRISVMLGPNAPQRCSPALLDLWRQLADELDLRVHTHLCETKPQAEYGRRTWPGGTVAELARRGLLNERLSVAHAVWLTSGERNLLARHGVTVSHNPASNLMLGSGVMPLADYLKRGVSVALGSDGANTGGAANLFEVMRLALALSRPNTAEDDWPTAATVLQLAAAGGARALGIDGGRVETGRLADLVLLRLDTTLTAAAEPSVAQIVQHGGAHAVAGTMVGGRWVYRDGRILAFDEAAVLARYQEVASSILGAARDRLNLAERAESQFRRLYPGF